MVDKINKSRNKIKNKINFIIKSKKKINLRKGIKTNEIILRNVIYARFKMINKFRREAISIFTLVV